MAQARSARARKQGRKKNEDPRLVVRTEQTRLVRCLLYDFVDYSGKRTKSFDVLRSDQELEVRTATYGPEIDQSQRTKSASHIINLISIYERSDVGISSNLIGSLSLTNGHCPPPGRWIMKQMARVNSCFAEVTENDILRMQDITIPNDTKKATKLGMIVFRDKQRFNTQLAHMSSVFCPDRQPPLMPLSLSNNCPSTLHFKVPSKSTQLPLSKTSPFKKI